MIKEKNEGDKMKLTSSDKKILETHAATMEAMGKYLGEGYELVLHSLDDENMSIIKIINGGLSKRKEGDPITELVFSMLKKIESNQAEDSIVFFNRNKFGEPTKATTIAIRGSKNRIIGLLCINFYLNTPFTRVMGSFIPEHNSMQQAPVIENITENTDELIMDAYQEAKFAVENDASVASADKNKTIIQILNRNGIFNLKDSVIKVAGVMNISKNTVYLHLRNLREGSDSRSDLSE